MSNTRHGTQASMFQRGTTIAAEDPCRINVLHVMCSDGSFHQVAPDNVRKRFDFYCEARGS